MRLCVPCGVWHVAPCPPQDDHDTGAAGRVPCAVCRVLGWCERADGKVRGWVSGDLQAVVAAGAPAVTRALHFEFEESSDSAVEAAAAGLGWAVGDGGAILQTTDAGVTWRGVSRWLLPHSPFAPLVVHSPGAGLGLGTLTAGERKCEWLN